MDSVLQKLQDIFIDVFDDDEIELNDSTTAEDIEEWDSLIHIQLIIAIESEFNMKFKTAEIQGLQNVGQMVELIKSKM